MDSAFDEPLFSSDVVKEEVMVPEEEQKRLAAGKDEKWPVKEETSESPLVKKEMEVEKIWRYGGCSTKKKSDFDGNPEAKRIKLAPGVEENNYATRLNAEVKEEAQLFPTAVIGQAMATAFSQACGSLPFAKLESDNQVFNAHDLFTNETAAKGEVESQDGSTDEEPHPREAVSEAMQKAAHEDDSESVEKKKMCPVDGCYEKCDSDEDLQKHMLTHPKPLICRICKRQCPKPGILRRHHMFHLGVKPFKCPTCDRGFSVAGNLKTHMRQHTDEHPYECEICGRKFKNATPLDYHRRTHSQETMFACSLCDYRSASAGNLTVHMSSHTGEKPFECSDCGSCFGLKADLKRHKDAIHLGLKKHSCPECEYKTANKSHLSIHIKRMHQK